MMNIMSLFKNNLQRAIAQKVVVIVAFVVIPVMIGAAVLFTQKTELKGSIALVTDNPVNIPRNNNIKIDVMKAKPPMSNLLSSKYLAIVEEKGGTYTVSTIKSEAEKKKVESFFRTGKIPEGNQEGLTLKGAGTNILGFILMILLMQGVVLITLYTQDRDSRTFRRIMTAPVSERLYLFVQGAFTFTMLFIPSYLAVAATKALFGVDIKFDYVTLAVLIGIISALSTSLALFIASVLERSYSLASSGIYIITCILSGCYISFTGRSRLLDELCNILPQKAYMTLAQGMESGKDLLHYSGQLIYLLFWILVLWLLSSVIIGRKMEKGVY